MGLGLAGLFAGIGLTFVISGLGLVWAARAETAKVPGLVLCRDACLTGLELRLQSPGGKSLPETAGSSYSLRASIGVQFDAAGSRSR